MRSISLRMFCKERQLDKKADCSINDIRSASVNSRFSHTSYGSKRDVSEEKLVNIIFDILGRGPKVPPNTPCLGPIPIAKDKCIGEPIEIETKSQYFKIYKDPENYMSYRLEVDVQYVTIGFLSKSVIHGTRIKRVSYPILDRNMDD